MAELIRENGLEGCSYAEPFAGGAGLALHLLCENVVSEIYLNDLDRSIYCLWKFILEQNDYFCDWLLEVPVTMDTWNWAKEIYNNFLTANPLELAKATFFLNRTNVSGIITGGPIGGPSQNGKYKIDARFNKSDLVKRLRRIHKVRNRIHLYCLDGVDFLKKLNRKHKPIFIYIDPPYVNKGADLYMNFFDEFQHTILRNQINKLRKYWIISYDDCDLINKLYSNYGRYRYSLSQCTSNRIGNELIILDNHINAQHSIHKLTNPIKITSE